MSNNVSLHAALPRTIELNFGRGLGLAARAVAPFVAVAQGIGSFAKAIIEAPGELRNMADELESTRPEAAARLRRVLQQGWGH